MPVVFPQITEASALGACLLAAAALNRQQTLRPDSWDIKISTKCEPDSGNTVIYRHIVKIYQRIYQQLEPVFEF